MFIIFTTHDADYLWEQGPMVLEEVFKLMTAAERLTFLEWNDHAVPGSIYRVFEKVVDIRLNIDSTELIMAIVKVK